MISGPDARARTCRDAIRAQGERGATLVVSVFDVYYEAKPQMLRQGALAQETL